jgi:hypothetical protein
MSLVADSIKFIEEWLILTKRQYYKNVNIPNSKQKVDLIVPDEGIGILYPNWKKPISVAIIHQSIHAFERLNLTICYIIADEISFHVENTLKRLNYPIKIVSSHQLSEIFYAIKPKSTIEI